MGSRSYGSASQAARLAGADFDQQRLAGAGAAAITLGTNQLTNLSKPFQKIYGKGLAETIAGRLVGRFGASTAMQMLIRFSNTADGRVFLSALGEMGEENLEGWLQAAWERFVYNPEAEYTAEEARRDRAVAGALGLIGGGFDVATDWRWDKNGQIQVGTDVETGARTPAVIDAFLEGFLDGDVESMRTKPDAAIERPYQGELPALPQGGALAALPDGWWLASEGTGGLQGTGGLPGAVDLRKLYEVALQNGVALPEIAREWYVEQQMSALRQEFLRRVYGVEPIVPRLPEWSGGGLEGPADAGDGALVPMLRDATLPEQGGVELESLVANPVESDIIEDILIHKSLGLRQKITVFMIRQLTNTISFQRGQKLEIPKCLPERVA